MDVTKLISELRWDLRYTHGHVPVTMENAAKALEQQQSELERLTGENANEYLETSLKS